MRRTHAALATAMAIVALLAAGGASAQQTADPSFGRVKTHAIEVCNPQGQRAYLARLVCADNSHPTFERLGNVGPRRDFPPDMPEGAAIRFINQAAERTPLEAGQTDHHMVDHYSVKCPDTTTDLFLDMYHCDAPAPRHAPAGFSITN